MLALLATAKFACFVALDMEAEAALREFNAAGRQRMYSQRVGLLAARFAAADAVDAPEAGRALGSVVEQMAEAHASLVRGAREEAWGTTDEQLRRLYFSKPNDIEARVDRFLGHARAIAAAPAPPGPGDADLRAVTLDAQGELLLALEQAVEVYGEKAATQRSLLRWVNLASYLGILATLGVIASAVFRPMAQVIRLDAVRRADDDACRRAAEGRADFATRLHAALSAVEREDEVVAVVAHALSGITTGSPVELLLADSSRAHLSRAVSNDVANREAGGCPVESPDRCLAVRQARTRSFPDSKELDACVRLRGRVSGPCGGVCVPITISGRAAGVLHATFPVGSELGADQVSRLEILATEAATRLANVRSLAEAQLQAATDPLTGLSNRRALAAAVSRLNRDAVPYTVALLDLDHFKRLNDTFGHDAGDRALRIFARVLREGARTDDVVSRFGGEEFAIVLPHTDPPLACVVLDRARKALELTLKVGEQPVFTFSAGVADAASGEEFDVRLHAADEALLRAKAAGRNRTELANVRAAAAS